MIDKCVKFNKDKEARRKQSRSKTLYNLEKRLTVSRGDSIVLVVVLLQIDVCSQCIEITTCSCYQLVVIRKTNRLLHNHALLILHTGKTELIETPVYSIWDLMENGCLFKTIIL